MSVNISYIICLLVDKACCMTQCHDLSRGSIVSMHNMLQRQRNATFPIAVTHGIFGVYPPRGEDDSTMHCALAPARMSIWEYIPSPMNWYSRLHDFFFLYEQRALFHRSNFPSLVYHRQSCTREVVALHCLVAKGSQKRCNISRRPEY